MKRGAARRRWGSPSIELALAVGACGIVFGRGAFQVPFLLVGAMATAWWAFTSEP
jgi:hypothetical protein